MAKKKPTNLKILQGSKRAKRSAKTEPRPVAKAPPCPSWLTKEARSHWAAVAPQLEPLGLLTPIDQDTFALYCSTWAKWREADDALGQSPSGWVFVTEKGYEGQSPLVAIERSLRETLAKLGDRFGLSPSARSGMKVQSDVPNEDPYESFRRKRKKA